MKEVEAVWRLQRLRLADSRPFLLHVGGNEWYKNREGLLRIFNVLRALPGCEAYRLVTVGEPWTVPMREYVSQVGLQDRVAELTDVSNDDLRALYSTAVALIFPSLCEGFGWPIIEAQACGCPVFATGRPPMREVGGSAAAYFDPLDELSAARTIAEGLKDKERLAKRGPENAARFSTDAMVRGYLEAYRTVLAGMTSAPASVTWPSEKAG